MNTCHFVGRITRDLEVKYTANGVAYVRFTLAVNRFGKQKDTTDWIDCVIWRTSAINLAKYCSKGSRISVSGMLASNNYTDSNGKKQYGMSVMVENTQFLDTKKASNQQSFQGDHPNAIKMNLAEENLPF